MGHSVADTKAYYKKGGISIKVTINTRAGIGTSSNKDAFRLS
jgi:hypothetical protein